MSYPSATLDAIVLQERINSEPLWHWGVAVGALALTLVGPVVIAAASNKEPAPASSSVQPASA